MDIKVITNEPEYEEALLRADQLMDAAAGTPEADELKELVLAIERYEDLAHPVDLPEPSEAIRFRVEQEEQRD